MKLPGWSFVVVGLGVGLLSLRQVLAGQKMGLFLLVGIGMLVYGLIRMFQESREGKADKEHEPLVHGGMHPHRPHPSHAAHSTHPHATHHAPHHAPAHTHAHQIPRICSTCHARNNPHANYCGHCGNKIRD